MNTLKTLQIIHANSFADTFGGGVAVPWEFIVEAQLGRLGIKNDNLSANTYCSIGKCCCFAQAI